MSKKKRDLPKYCYARGNKIWMRVKDDAGNWINKPTGFDLSQVDEARKFVAGIVRGYDARRPDGTGFTVAKYLARWLKEREERGVASVKQERPRFECYIEPYLGHISMAELRTFQIRDWVRALRALKKADGSRRLAPRTIHHIYQLLHNAMEGAVVEDIITANPVKVGKHDLPKKVDADPEWRVNATYTLNEVERLISDAIIPPERRVQYAIKMLAGARHGEFAALCFRHIDYSMEPLPKIQVVQAFDSIERVVKSTKSEEVRGIPLHPTLAKILAVWKLEHWPRIYGRMPTPDDYIVPTRTFNCVNAADAGHAMKKDFDALGLRKEAGKKRHRGGHDLRSWFETRCIEDGADSLIVDRFLHASDKSVAGGYQRFSWEVLCRELGKLKVKILDGKILELGTSSLHRDKVLRSRYDVVTPKGLEALSRESNSCVPGGVLVGDSIRADPRGSSESDRNVPAPLQAELEAAIRCGQTARALELTRRMFGGEHSDQFVDALAKRRA